MCFHCFQEKWKTFVTKEIKWPGFKKKNCFWCQEHRQKEIKPAAPNLSLPPDSQCPIHHGKKKTLKWQPRNQPDHTKTTGWDSTLGHPLASLHLILVAKCELFFLLLKGQPKVCGNTKIHSWPEHQKRKQMFIFPILDVAESICPFPFFFFS